MICLSFDTDHLDQSRMEEFLSEVPVPGAGTFFCTETYSGLDFGGHELCPHPTFEPGSDWAQELDRARTSFPDARGFRAHNCIWSHMLTLELSRRGFDYVSAHDRFGEPPTPPFREAWGLWHLPIYYMDNLDLSFGLYWPDPGHEPLSPGLLEAAVADRERIYVFDFHPIHLLLNSTSIEDYLSRRDSFRSGTPIGELRCEGRGVRDFYEELLGMMEAKGLVSASLSAAVDSASGAVVP